MNRESLEIYTFSFWKEFVKNKKIHLEACCGRLDGYSTLKIYTYGDIAVLLHYKHKSSGKTGDPVSSTIVPIQSLNEFSSNWELVPDFRNNNQDKSMDSPWIVTIYADGSITEELKNSKESWKNNSVIKPFYNKGRLKNKLASLT